MTFDGSGIHFWSETFEEFTAPELLGALIVKLQPAFFFLSLLFGAGKFEFQRRFDLDPPGLWGQAGTETVLASAEYGVKRVTAEICHHLSTFCGIGALSCFGQQPESPRCPVKTERAEGILFIDD